MASSQAPPDASQNALRSPSPPPKLPVSNEPGPRAQALDNIFNTALTHTISTCSYAHFASCFPTPARYNKALVESIWRQVQNMIESRSRREFEEIMAERDVVKGLNELDQLIKDAKLRMQSGQDVPLVQGYAQCTVITQQLMRVLRLHEVPSEQLFLAHLAPMMKEAESKLEAEISQMETENMLLLHSMRQSEDEVDRLVIELETTVKDLEAASDVMDDAVSGVDMKAEIRKVDDGIDAKDVGRASRL